MKKIEPGQVLSILANFSVLVGILLLVYELSQNRAMMQAQTRMAVSEGLSEWIYNVTADPEIVNLMGRGNRGEELSDDERRRYGLLVVAQLRYYENVHYQQRAGLYDDDEFAAQREAWRSNTLSSIGVRDIFCRSRAVFSQDFVTDLESLLSEPCD